MSGKQTSRRAGKGVSRRTTSQPSHQARSKSVRKKKRQRKRRLTDKIRAALARAATLGRHDVTEQLGTLYQARVEEELDGGRLRRARDAEAKPRKAVRGR